MSSVDIDVDMISKLTIGVVLGLIGIAYGLQKLVKEWKETSTETSVITMMHSELERLSAQNSILAIELNKLQLEIIKLTKELNYLTIEKQRLTEDIADLTDEVERLSSLLAKQKGATDGSR